ncbi:nucleosidase [uncultured Bacteroides sp.]|uniref:5'-methylthioadenosine/S-adenosylhomocysteine nucleosidase family protein n=1 Tax=uncultured Bacteroides sp. TaxID=162156 RepID=UPI002AAC482A|nr:nucleosidase [uncultured Bacteroides sp.]
MLKVLITHAVNDELITVNLSGCEVKYVRTGIGKVKATIRLMDALAQERPDVVINLGTAGTVDHNVGEVFVCRHFIDRDLQKVGCLNLEHETDSSSLLEEKGYCCDWKCEGVCNTGDSFLTETADSHGDVFDMEAYAQAQVCQMKNIPFIAVKYVTDKIGENSIKHWEDKLADARKGLSDFLNNCSLI